MAEDTDNPIEGDEKARCPATAQPEGQRCRKPAGHVGWHEREMQDGTTRSPLSWAPATPEQGAWGELERFAAWLNLGNVAEVVAAFRNSPHETAPTPEPTRGEARCTHPRPAYRNHWTFCPYCGKRL